jgi:hypothetical protein
LGSFFFPFDFINLQVHKPASADLLTSQFKGELREIHPDFLSRSFATGAWLFHPTDVHRARMHLYRSLSLRACIVSLDSERASALYARLSTLEAVHFLQNFTL